VSAANDEEGFGAATCTQVDPFNLAMIGLVAEVVTAPTAKQLVTVAHDTPAKIVSPEDDVGELCTDHAEPSQCSISECR
jgi:hypothetical protein